MGLKLRNHQRYYNSSWGNECLNQISLQSIQQLSRYLTKSQKFHSYGGTRRNIRVPPKSGGVILWGPWMTVQNIMEIYPIAVEMFQSEPKWWADWLAIHKTRLLPVQTFHNTSVCPHFTAKAMSKSQRISWRKREGNQYFRQLKSGNGSNWPATCG